MPRRSPLRRRNDGCGPDCCDSHEICCGGKCHPVAKPRTCCRPTRAPYNPHLEELCKHGEHCCRDEFAGTCFDPKHKVCCSGSVTDKADCCNGKFVHSHEECCGSGANAHVVPKGKCKHGKCKRPGFPATYTACGATCCGGKTPICCNSPTGAACCAAGQACGGGRTVQCVTPYPKGDWHFGNYDGKPNENVFCCPGGDGGTCGTTRARATPPAKAAASAASVPAASSARPAGAATSSARARTHARRACRSAGLPGRRTPADARAPRAVACHAHRRHWPATPPTGLRPADQLPPRRMFGCPWVPAAGAQRG